MLIQAQAVPDAYITSSPINSIPSICGARHRESIKSARFCRGVVAQSKGSRRFQTFARDIVQHPWHAKLVTISTCYGSRLRTYAGEGLVGLA